MRHHDMGASANPHCYDAYGMGRGYSPLSNPRLSVYGDRARERRGARARRRYGAYGFGQAEKKPGPLDGIIDTITGIIGGSLQQIKDEIDKPGFINSPMGQQLIGLIMDTQPGISAQEALAQLRAQVQPQKQTPAWVLPVAIGGGVLVLGLIIVLATRR